MNDGARIEVDVLPEAALWAALPEAADLVTRAVKAACAASGARLPPGTEIAVVLGDDAGLRALNRDWLGNDKPTNVLSFPTPASARTGGEPHLGDIAIAFETLEREAAADGKPVGAHLIHLAVHGTLHLLGYDHEDSAQAEAMESLERTVLAGLGVSDPYAETDPVI